VLRRRPGPFEYPGYTIDHLAHRQRVVWETQQQLAFVHHVPQRTGSM
jgi:hypothetical protein